MRVNVYAEELIDRVEVISKTAATGSTFVGLRFYLESSPKMMPPQHPDDDASAVTFWVKSGKNGYVDGDAIALIAMLRKAADKLVKEAASKGFRRYRPPIEKVTAPSPI